MAQKDNPPQKAPRATSLRQIAEVAGVHVSTVSLALRNSPQLPAATRKKLQNLAREMGYEPNPLISILMQHRRNRRQLNYRGTLAFITQSTSGNMLRCNPYVAQIFETAAKHAEELGYKLEHHETYDYNNNPRRLEKVLHTRNIRGLFFPPTENPEGITLDLNWEHFACITVSSSIIHPPMDRVDGDHLMGSRLAFQKCLELGYRAPGFASLQSSDHRTQGRWRAGFLSAQQDSGSHCRKIPVLVSPDSDIVENLIAWYRKWKPDVILANALVHTACIPALRKNGIRIPEDVGIVELNIHDLNNPNSGIYTGLEISTQRAIDQLINRVQRNMLGLPIYPEISITNPIWKDGVTTPGPRK